jgi:hypothetical protein
MAAVGDVAEDAAVQGAHRVREALVGRQLHHHAAALDRRHLEAEQAGDRRRRRLAAQQLLDVQECLGHDRSPIPIAL